MVTFCQLIKHFLLMRKKNKKHTTAFTLIEVIVVAVIVAVLAAVAIPIYNGYVKNSLQNVVDNTAGSAATFCATSRDQGNNVATQLYVANSKMNGAKNTTWQVPKEISVTVAPNSVTVTHTKDVSRTQTQNY